MGVLPLVNRMTEPTECCQVSHHAAISIEESEKTVSVSAIVHASTVSQATRASLYCVCCALRLYLPLFGRVCGGLSVYVGVCARTCICDLFFVLVWLNVRSVRVSV